MMNATHPVTIADAKDIAYRLRKRGVLILTLSAEGFSGASYGMTRRECDAMGELLDKIMAKLQAGELDPTF